MKINPGLPFLMVVGATPEQAKSVGIELMRNPAVRDAHNIVTLGDYTLLKEEDWPSLIFYFLKGWISRDDSAEILALFDKIDASHAGPARLFDPTTNREIQNA